jgi:hypothetical protein
MNAEHHDIKGIPTMLCSLPSVPGAEFLWDLCYDPSHVNVMIQIGHVLLTHRDAG